MDYKYLLKILIIVFIIFSLIIFINSIGLNLNEPIYSKKLTNVITMEGLENNKIFNDLTSSDPLTTNSSKAFCQVNKGAQQEKSCNALTNYNCNLTSCCIWTSDNKCKAGNASGALFGSNSKGKTIPLDYYFFQNQCYGQNCPNEQI
jgi:hypothetical protein